MRILILTTQDRFFLSHVSERASYFKAHGCQLAVVAQKTSDDLVHKIRSMGFDFYDSKIERQSLNPYSQIKALFRLFKIVKKFKPDLSYHLGAKAIFYGTFISKCYNLNTKIVNAPIGLGFVYASQTKKAKFLKPLVEVLYKLFLNPRGSKVILENHDDLDYFVKKKYANPDDVFCISGAGVDINIFSPLPFSERNSVCTVVMASRLIREKGVSDFVEVSTQLYKKGIAVRMQLVGMPDIGNPSSLSMREFTSIKNNPAIECLGFREDMPNLLKKAHICCLPSYYREGLPRILIEAASSGLVIITTDTVGCREAVRDGNGFLIPPHDIKAMCETVEFLVKNPDILQVMCQRSRKVAEKYYDTSIVCRRTWEIFKTLIVD